MITLVQKAVNYFAGNSNPDAVDISELERPKLEEFISVPCAKIETRFFEGRVTSLSTSCIVIEYDIYCDPSKFTLGNVIGLNDQVRGVAEREGRHEAWRVTRAQLAHEEWDAELSSQSIAKEGDRDCGRRSSVAMPSGGVISCRELAEGIPGILKQDVISPPLKRKNQPENLPVKSDIKDCAAMKTEDGSRSIMGQVMGICGDTVSLSDNVTFQMSSSTCDFDMMEGDWVICEIEENDGTVEVDSNTSAKIIQVASVRALRRKKVRGKITHQLHGQCIVNSEIYCPLSVVGVSSLRTGDWVMAEVMESEQRQLRWRVVSVTPVPPTPSIRELCQASPDHSITQRVVSQDLLQDKKNIVISPSLRFPEVSLGSYVELKASVRNVGSDMKVLKKTYFMTTVQESQFTISSEESKFRVYLDPGVEVQVKLVFTGKLIGEAKELCIFDFGDFRIGRHVSAKVTDPLLLQLAPVTPHVSATRRHTQMSPVEDVGNIILGEKPFRPPTFLPVSIPPAHVPEQLRTAVGRGRQEVLRVVPALADPLTPYNHREKFAAVLHLEEIEISRQMRQFDMERVVFERHGEYLSLSVCGLAERRPSLMVGDTVEAWQPHVPGDTTHHKTVYQGYIHQVLNSKVLLKFHPGFHDHYQGEDYSVCYNINRTALRRCHFALHFATSQLGSDVIFPSKLNFQLPQVCYVDPEAPVPPTRATSGTRKNVNKSLVEKSPQLPCCGKSVRAESHSENDVTDTCNLSVKMVKENCKETYTSRGDSCLQESEGLEKGKDCTKKGENVMFCNEARLKQETNQKNASVDNSNDIGKQVGEACVKTTISKPPPPLRRKQNTTPPRIPVVTRLFGIHSSESSTNSSMCCSDDDDDDDDDGVDEADKNTDTFSFSEEPPLKANLERNMGKMEPRVKSSLIRSSNSKMHTLTTPYDSKGKEGNNCSVSANKNILKSHLRSKQDGSLPSLTATNNNNDKDKDELNIKCINNNKLPQIVTPHGKKLFIPRTLELSYYRNVTPKKEMRGKGEIVSLTPKIEGVKRKDRKLCDETHDNRKQDNGKLSSVPEFQETKCQNRTPHGKAPTMKYVTPVLPIHPNRNRGINPSLPVLKWFNSSLNREQKLAVRRILEGTTRPLPYVIFGPPGTGKTVTLVEAALQILSLMPDSRILVVTPSNSASDLVAERLVKSGQLGPADLLRLNAYQRSEESIPVSLRPYCQTGEGLASGAAMRRVTAATATTAGVLYTLSLHNRHYTHVFVDEAGQLTEPETLLVMGLVNRVSGQVVLAGDPKQLGPVVMSRLASSFGLQQSLLHRLCQSVLYQPQEVGDAWWYEPSLVTQLVHNYRSHPDILTVPSNLFYNNTLLPSADMKPLEYLVAWDELPRPGFPLLFHGIIGENMQEGDSPSWFNPAEAFQVVRYSKSLVSFGVSPQHIGIITPYRKQVEKIVKLLGTFGVAAGVKVGSVEEFQGQEREVVLISTVRSSSDLVQTDIEHSLGFVGCPRRFNVAVTRAQALLVMVGDPSLLSRDNSWREMMTFCIGQGAYRGPDVETLFNTGSTGLLPTANGVHRRASDGSTFP